MITNSSIFYLKSSALLTRTGFTGFAVFDFDREYYPSRRLRACSNISIANSVTLARRAEEDFWLASYAEAKWRAISNAFAHISGAISWFATVRDCVLTLINRATIVARRSLCSSVNHPKGLCSDNSLSFLQKNYSAPLK